MGWTDLAIAPGRLGVGGDGPALPRAAGRHARRGEGSGVARRQSRRLPARDPGRRRPHGRVRGDYGVPDGGLRAPPPHPAPHDPAFPTYQQFLHMGEAGLATLIMVPLVSGFIAPEAERDNWGA